MSGPAEHHPSTGWDPRSFYERQDELTPAASGAVTDAHRAKAALTRLHCGHPRRVLELGAGGGQVALATAELGFAVDAVELVPRLAARARELAGRSGKGRLNVIEGDFYTAAIDGPYGAVTYWDGFGLGADSDQQALLRRVREWLADDGRALIEVYTPWYWQAVAGREMAIGDARRRYDFDPETQTMVDTWWSTDAPQEAVSQRLRCYAPEQLRQLLEPVALTLTQLVPGGGYDKESGSYREQAPIEEAMTYTAVLART
jgi:SAM-dependent methyltransferase